MKSRQDTVNIALSYVGVKQGSAKHKALVDTFNSVKPHGEVAKTSYPWCAITVSAVQILAGNQSIAPLSQSCGNIISYAKKMGIWKEADDFIPSIGDYILYDWQDDGVGDNTGAPDHVGMVYSVDANYIYVVEGNKGTTKTCGKRAIAINGKFIRGFVHINYPETKKETKKEVKSETTRLTADGLWGTATTKAAQKHYGTTVDGEVSGQSNADKPYLIAITTSWKFTGGGSKLIKAIQKHVGISADGYCGPSTIKALQKFLKAKGYYKGNIDGYLGTLTVKAFQKYLNGDFVLTN